MDDDLLEQEENHRQAIALARIFHSPYTLLLGKTMNKNWQFFPYFWSPVDGKLARQ